MSQNLTAKQLENLVEEYALVYWSSDRTVSRLEDEQCSSDLTRIMGEIQLAFERLQRENIALEAKLAAAEAELDIAKDVIKQAATYSQQIKEARCQRRRETGG